MAGMITTDSMAPPPSGWPPDHNLVPHDVATLADEPVAYHYEAHRSHRRQTEQRLASS